MGDQLRKQQGSYVVLHTNQERHPGGPYVAIIEDFDDQMVTLSPAQRLKKEESEMSDIRYATIAHELSEWGSRPDFAITLSRNVIASVRRLDVRD